MLFIIAIIAAIALFVFYRTARKQGKKTESTFSLGGVGVAILIAAMQVFTVIPAGSVGVIDFLGKVSDTTLKAGVNLVNPLANVVVFSIKTQELKEVMTVPSEEGLSVKLEISLLFHLNPEWANKIYKTVGENYASIIVVPQFRSAVRGVTAKYNARALYTSERATLAEEIKTEIAKLVGDRGVTIENAPLREIILPQRLTASIEEKLQAEQESQRMEFVLMKEEQEAERKRIEAKGIADFQDIVSRGISKQLLQWKGIEATENLANSQNAKVIIIGAGDEGLPVILGGTN